MRSREKKQTFLFKQTRAFHKAQAGSPAPAGGWPRTCAPGEAASPSAGRKRLPCGPIRAQELDSLCRSWKQVNVLGEVPVPSPPAEITGSSFPGAAAPTGDHGGWARGDRESGSGATTEGLCDRGQVTPLLHSASSPVKAHTRGAGSRRRGNACEAVHRSHSGRTGSLFSGVQPVFPAPSLGLGEEGEGNVEMTSRFCWLHQ